MNRLISVPVTARARRISRAGLAMLAALLLWVPPAAAQLSSIGSNPGLINFPVRGSDTAYDPINNVYLVVGTHGALHGVFVNSAGAPVTGSFAISSGGAFPQFPRVRYSRDLNNGAGGFLVTWHDSIGLNNFVHTRVVAYPNQLVTAPVTISAGNSYHETGASIAYSQSSRVFLVVWKETSNVVMGALVGLNGQAAGPAFTIAAPGGGGARDPNVTWNPYTNEFGVVYTGWDTAAAITGFARVSAGGTVLRRNTFNFASLTYITDIAFNTATGRFLAAWFQPGGTQGAEIDANGDVVAQGLLSSTTGQYDGLGVSYNPVSGTFLLVGHGPTHDVWAAELNSRGARTSADVPITSHGGPVGSFYPRAAANTNAPQWNASYSHNFNLLRGQVVATSSAGGGPGGTLGPPPGGGTTEPPPPPPPSGGCTSPQPGPGWTCVNGGWIPPTSGSGGSSTGGCTSPAPGPGWTCVNGGWVPDSGGTSGGCTSPSPGSGWTCVNGGWVPPTSSCTTPSPGPGWTCVGGGWVPGTSSGSGGTSGGCTSPAPGSGWTCVNGGWVPPTSSCTTPSPGPGWTCVGGGWVPGTTSGSGGSSGGCTTPSPGSGWTCVNGGWVPATSSCATPSPGSGWTCVNGGWVPPTSGGSGGGCSTPDPFAAIGGGTCVNGGWIPPTSSCTTPSPGPGWICVGGGWIPGTLSGSGAISGGCSTPSPGAGWTCVNGGWIPSSGGGGGGTSGGCTTPDPFVSLGGGTCVNGGWTFVATSTSGGCSTPDPFTAIGGGICINGGWIPKTAG